MTGDPGARAAAERADHVRSPLHEAGMGKAEIRAAARELGLPNWDKPALACLSSRVPYGQNVYPREAGAHRPGRTSTARARLPSAARAPLRRSCASRDRARGAQRVAAEGLAERIEADLLRLGFPAVEIDPRGYRSGSLNEGVVPLPLRHRCLSCDPFAGLSAVLERRAGAGRPAIVRRARASPRSSMRRARRRGMTLLAVRELLLRATDRPRAGQPRCSRTWPTSCDAELRADGVSVLVAQWQHLLVITRDDAEPPVGRAGSSAC